MLTASRHSRSIESLISPSTLTAIASSSHCSLHSAMLARQPASCQTHWPSLHNLQARVPSSLRPLSSCNKHIAPSSILHDRYTNTYTHPTSKSDHSSIPSSNEALSTDKKDTNAHYMTMTTMIMTIARPSTSSSRMNQTQTIHIHPEKTKRPHIT
jgi:hypothetical protein